MKIWAMMNVYNECDWMLHHVAHIYPYVDHILITEGSNSTATKEIPARSDDGTIKLSSYLDKRLKKVRFLGPGKVNENNKVGQAMTFNVMLETAWEMGAKESDWIFLADPDEIMVGWFLKKLKNMLEKFGDTISAIETYGPMFWFNMKLFIWQHRERMWRLRDDCHFRPTVQYCLKNGPCVNTLGETTVLIGGEDQATNFHYAFVKPPFRELTRRKWEVACGYRKPVVLNWYRDVFMKWNYEDMGKVAYSTNERLTGGKGILFGGDEQLMIWEGKHPKVAEDHPMKKIDDIRQIRESRVIIDNERIFHHILRLDDYLFTTELTALLEELK